MPSINAPRWHAKKAARLAAATATSAATVLRPLLGAPPVVRVLTYHCFGFGRRDPFCLDPSAFERQIGWLARQGLAVSLDDVRAFLAGQRTLRDGAVLVTIDDGDAGIASHAWPILKRHGVPAVAFIIAGEMGAPGRLSARQVQELADEGLAIGSHSLTHPSMARIGRLRAHQEAVRSRQLLEEAIGCPVTAFAYPYGTLTDFDAEVAAILAASGYACAFTSQHGPIRPGMAPFTLPRVKVEAGDPAWLFPLLCRGGLDCWRLVDRTLTHTQRPHAGEVAA
jgi:peptidoglycan/xylan/chitin deacetylase (PgdA/CDA1 family)